MRIDYQRIPEIQKAYQQLKKSDGQNKTAQVGKKDGIELSPDAKLFSMALSELRKFPETDETKLNRLKESVQTGSYRINHEEVAEKIWQESVLDKRV